MNLVTSRGKNIVIEYRNAEGKLDQVPRNAVELVRLKVDVIVTAGPTERGPPRKRRAQFPLSWRRTAILLETGSSPVLPDLAETLLDCPALAPELSGKQMELLKEIVPRLSRVAVLGNFDRTGQRTIVKRGGTRRRGVRGEASIPRHTDRQGY